jgi:hypothetical protein
MTETDFWKLIDSVRHSVSTDTEMPALLVDRLKRLSIQEIIDFGRLWRAASIAAYDEHVWAAAYAILEGCSNDTFSDFRGWLIAQGRARYERVLANPDSLAEMELLSKPDQIPNLGFSLGGVVFDAYEAKTGQKDLREILGPIPSSAWRLKNEGIWEDSEESLKQVVPRLYAKFYART